MIRWTRYNGDETLATGTVGSWAAFDELEAAMRAVDPDMEQLSGVLVESTDGPGPVPANAIECDLCQGEYVVEADGLRLCEAHAEWSPESLVDLARGILESVRGSLSLGVVRRLEDYICGTDVRS